MAGRLVIERALLSHDGVDKGAVDLTGKPHRAGGVLQRCRERLCAAKASGRRALLAGGAAAGEGDKSAKKGQGRLTMHGLILSRGVRAPERYARKMESLAKVLLAVAALLALVGGVLLIATKLGIQRLPGDIVIRRGNFTLYAPLGLMVLLSVAGTILLNLFWRS